MALETELENDTRDLETRISEKSVGDKIIEKFATDDIPEETIKSTTEKLMADHITEILVANENTKDEVSKDLVADEIVETMIIDYTIEKLAANSSVETPAANNNIEKFATASTTVSKLIGKNDIISSKRFQKPPRKRSRSEEGYNTAGPRKLLQGVDLDISDAVRKQGRISFYSQSQCLASRRFDWRKT
jgi:hypothetical protein